MKIVLTGQPGVGKSTVLEKVIQLYEGKKVGVICKEIRDKDGIRVGFMAVNSRGDSKVFAHTTAISSTFTVGKYFVDIEAIDSFILPEISSAKTPDTLVYIDEIGRMEAHSERFLATVDTIFGGDSSVLATVVRDPKPWSLQYKTNPLILVLTVTATNREKLPPILQIIFSLDSQFKCLSIDQQKLVFQMAGTYFSLDQFTHVTKLFTNAIPYVLQGKVRQNNPNFVVIGNHGEHRVNHQNSNYICDCNLYQKSGDCSHIQAVKISILAQ